MISRRNFLKLIGIVPVMLTLPIPKKLLEEPVISPPTTIWGFPIKYTEDEFLFYSGTSAISDMHIGMADALWRSHSGGKAWLSTG